MSYRPGSSKVKGGGIRRRPADRSEGRASRADSWPIRSPTAAANRPAKASTAAGSRARKARSSARAARISSTDSPVSMAMTPPGPSMKVWLERPLPTRHQTPGRTV